MRQILTPFLAFHWMAVFALPAMGSAVGSGGVVSLAFDLMGVTTIDGDPPLGTVARVMAAAAAHGSTLSRISGRPEIGFGGEQP